MSIAARSVPVNAPHRSDFDHKRRYDADYYTGFELAHDLRLGGDFRFWNRETREGRLWATKVAGRIVVPARVVADYLRVHRRRIPKANSRAIQRVVRHWAADPVHSARQLIDMKVRLEWIIPRWLGRGTVALLVAKPHAGKSYLALDLAIAIAGQDQTFLKREVQAHGPVLVVTTQDRAPRLQRRLRLLRRGRGMTVRAAKDLPIYFHVLNKPLSLNEADGVDELRAKVRSTLPVLVVLDLWTDFLSASSNGEEVIRDAASPLHEMRHELGCTFLAVCHAAKSQWDGHGELSARGSGHLEGSADSKLTLRPQKSSVKLGVWCRDSNIGAKPPISIRLDCRRDGNGRTAHKWKVVTEEAKRRSRQRVSRQRIWDRITEGIRSFKVKHGRPPNTRELREHAGLNNENGGRLLKDDLADLTARGLIKLVRIGNASVLDLL